MKKRYLTLFIALGAGLMRAEIPQLDFLETKTAIKQPAITEQPVPAEWTRPEKKQPSKPVLLRIKNKTSDDILVAIKGHTTKNDLVNALRIPKGKASWTFVGNVSRRGPFIIARAKDLRAQITKMEFGKEKRYTVAFKLPETTYIFPIGRLILMGRGEGAISYVPSFNSIIISEVEGGLNLRAKRTFPWIFPWEKAWVPLERKEVPLGTQGEPILVW